MPEAVILTEVRARVATLTFHRPEKLNALNAELLSESITILKEWGRDPDIGAIVVTGAGRAFCAGGDVSADGGLARVQRRPTFWNRMIDRSLRGGHELVTAAL